MASGIRKFFQSPLRVVLIVQGLCVLASWGILAAGVIKLAHSSASGGGKGGLLDSVGAAVSGVSSGAGGLTIFWIVVSPLAVLLLWALICGLVYGKWGLPGYLQGRSVLIVPLTSAFYFAAGWLGLRWIEGKAFAEGWQALTGLLSGWPGLSLVLLYAALSTSAAGLGWAAALAVTAHKRRHGKWETIGYVERPQ